MTVLVIFKFYPFNLNNSQFFEELLVMCHVVGAATIN